MTEQSRAKVERQYRTYRRVIDGPVNTKATVPERSVCRFLSWLEAKTNYRITEAGEVSEPIATEKP